MIGHLERHTATVQDREEYIPTSGKEQNKHHVANTGEDDGGKTIVDFGSSVQVLSYIYTVPCS